jgi:HSP20 family protein
MVIDPGQKSPLITVVDRLFRETLAPYVANVTDSVANGGSTGVQSLPLTVWETAEGYEAVVPVPGLDEQSINVTLDQDTLSIQAERRFEVPEGARVLWQEFGSARFRRSLRLGAAVDPGRVEASYHNGLLTLRMPKGEHATPRRIQVQGMQPEAIPGAMHGPWPSERVGVAPKAARRRR